MLILAALIALFPVIRVFGTALRPGDNLLNPSLDIIPKGATLDAFHHVLFETSLPNWLFNSLVITVGTAAHRPHPRGHVRLRVLALQVPGREAWA